MATLLKSPMVPYYHRNGPESCGSKGSTGRCISSIAFLMVPHNTKNMSNHWTDHSDAQDCNNSPNYPCHRLLSYSTRTQPGGSPGTRCHVYKANHLHCKPSTHPKDCLFHDFQKEPVRSQIRVEAAKLRSHILALNCPRKTSTYLDRG